MSSCWWAAILIATLQSTSPSGSGTAFFYGTNVPVNALSFYDRVVLDPDQATPGDVARLVSGSTEVLAYLSVGEIGRHRSWYGELDPGWVLGHNGDWNSDVFDLTVPGYRSFLLQRMKTLHDTHGYHGFFLDTLDSYHLVTRGEARQAQAEALVQLIRAMRSSLPECVLIVNRGFEILPAVAPLVSGVVAESLYRSWNPTTRTYTEVSVSDREWLIEQLLRVRLRYQLPVTAIDYVPASKRGLRRQVAKSLESHGFTPWVATPSLDTMGVGLVEFVPRRVLGLYSSRQQPMAESNLHRLLGVCLDSLGLAIDYVDVNDSLPGGALSGRYAGVVCWFEPKDVRDPQRFEAWLKQQLNGDLRIAFFGALGFTPSANLLDRLGLIATEKRLRKPVRLESTPPWARTEASPKPRSREVPKIRLRDGTAILSLIDADETRVDPVFLTDWGGMALRPYVTQGKLDGSRRWLIDPLSFLRESLALEPIPVPDVTTENGSRLAFAHIDGDGAVSRAEWTGGPLAAVAVLEEVLEVFPLPTTVSFVEAEISPNGLYPVLSPILEGAARRTFALPHVEMATHSYSHPFDWITAMTEPGDIRHRLPVRNYEVDMDREIGGSAAYLDQFAPPAERVEVMLWSGTALPPVEALDAAERANLLNLNGGNTQITRDRPSLTEVSSILRPVGRHLQVYAPIMNENIYTNLWRGPFYGFRRVIETFELTESPRRLKPIDIYYHFYSGSKRSSLEALLDVYKWTMEQEILPIFASEYVRMALAFDRVTLARKLDGEWIIRGLGELRTVRLPRSMGWPSLLESAGVVCVRDDAPGRYVSFSEEGPHHLRLQSHPPDVPHIRRSDARLVSWARDGRGFRARFANRGPVRLVLAGLRADDTLHFGGHTIPPTKQDDTWVFELPEGNDAEAVLRAP